MAYRERSSKDSKDKKKTFYKKDSLFKRKKYCKLCDSGVGYVDYKDINTLQGYLRERAKLVPRRISGACAHHQRQITTAVKRARHLALLPFTTD
jgi:small subunit ribosomal protein S18